MPAPSLIKVKVKDGPALDYSRELVDRVRVGLSQQLPVLKLLYMLIGLSKGDKVLDSLGEVGGGDYFPPLLYHLQ